MRTAAKNESKELKRVGKSREDLANKLANLPFKSDERRVRHMYLYTHPVLFRCAETPRYLYFDHVHCCFKVACAEWYLSLESRCLDTATCTLREFD